MNKIISILLLTSLLFSCEADPVIMNPDAEPAWFIYGCLDLRTGNHQVRVRQAIQIDGDAREYAQDPVMILPDEPIRVALRIDRQGVIDTVDFHPVGYEKDPGSWAEEDNIIHELHKEIEMGDVCKLIVKGLESGKEATAGAPVFEKPRFSHPYIMDNPWYAQEFSFTNVDKPFYVTYSAPAQVFKLITEIKYLDVLHSGDTLYRIASFAGQPFFPYNREPSRVFDLPYLYNIFNRVIPDDPDVKYRKFYRFNFKGWAASKALQNYLQFGQKFRDNRKLSFFNINNGFGIFYSCSYGETGHIAPLNSFMDTLAKSPYLKDLKFVRWRHNGAFIDPDSTLIEPIF